MTWTMNQIFRREFPLAAVRLPIYLSPRQIGEDVRSMASATLRENERLSQMARDLEQSTGRPEELEKMMKNLLPTLDGFDRVLHLGRSYPQTDVVDNWLKSVESIYFRLLNTLENYELYQMRAVGSKVDLNLHEVVEYRPSTDHVNDTIIYERQKGYILRGKLLRDAKVVVVYNEKESMSV